MQQFLSDLFVSCALCTTIMTSPVVTVPQQWWRQLSTSRTQSTAEISAEQTTAQTTTSRRGWGRRTPATPSPRPTVSPVPRVSPSPIIKTSPSPALKVAVNSSPSPSPKPSASPAAIPLAQGKYKWGAYVGWQDGAVANFESMVGKPANIIADFIHWGNEKDFPMHYTSTVRDKGKTLVIYWQAKDYNVDGPDDTRFNYDAVNAGKWDSYFKEFATAAKTYNGPVILVPFDEMNDNVAPWSGTQNNNSPDKHIQAYRHIRDIFRPIAPNVKFGWAVNSLSVPNQPGNKMEEYYPGDSYVDYVGVDGFNFGNPWQSFDQVFAPALNVLQRYKKPIYLFSMGSMEGSQKAAWIQDGLGNAILKYPNIEGWIWFNEDKAENGERDWRINSDANALNAFKAILP